MKWKDPENEGEGNEERRERDKREKEAVSMYVSQYVCARV